MRENSIRSPHFKHVVLSGGSSLCLHKDKAIQNSCTHDTINHNHGNRGLLRANKLAPDVHCQASQHIGDIECKNDYNSPNRIDKINQKIQPHTTRLFGPGHLLLDIDIRIVSLSLCYGYLSYPSLTKLPVIKPPGFFNPRHNDLHQLIAGKKDCHRSQSFHFVSSQINLFLLK